MCPFVTAGRGVLVPGGFGSRGIEGKVLAAQWARTHNIPFLGICLGLQVAVIGAARCVHITADTRAAEFARNVLGLEGANTTEIDEATPHPVVINMPEISTTQKGALRCRAV